MFKDITLGQYFPGNSPIHRLDPRTKILLMIAYIVMVFLVKNLLLYLVPAALVVGIVAIANIPMRYLYKSLKPLRWLLVIMFVINILFTAGETVLLEFWIIRITKEAIERAVFILIRLALLVTGTSMMTLTTSPLSLTDGLERLLSPLKKVKFPAHELAMMMTIALRFIPTLLEEADKISKAQLARGADFESGNIFKRAKNMIPLLVPLFVSAFRRADELAMAMESRCYHGDEGRTRMKVLRFAKADLVAAVVVLGLIALIVVVQIWI